MELNLTAQRDKTFSKSEKVDHRKVTFRNRYGITLAAGRTLSRLTSSQTFSRRT